MVFEAHCMSFPCTEHLLFNYAKVKTVFHSMAPLSISLYNGKSNSLRQYIPLSISGSASV